MAETKKYSTQEEAPKQEEEKGMSTLDFDDTIPPTKYGMNRTPAMYTPYKMKGSPMHRNFGISGGVTSPAKQELPKIDNPDADPAVNTKPGGFGKLAQAVMGARAGGGGADHTHPEFAQLDEGMQKIASGEFSGGVGGGGAETEPWKAMGMDEFKGMDRGARREYIQGLSPDQKKQQSLEFTALNDPRKGLSLIHI